MPCDAFTFAKLHKPFICVFSPVVCPQVFHLLSYLILHLCLPYLEGNECIRLLLEKVNPSLPGKVINKADEVSSSTLRINRCRSLDFGMNIIQLFRACVLCFLEADSVLLPHDAKLV